MRYISSTAYLDAVMLDGLIKILKILILGVLFAFEAYYLGGIFFKDKKASVNTQSHYLVNIDEGIDVKMSTKIIEKLEKLKREKRLKSLLVVLDTPGGSPVASENLYSYFKSLGQEIPLYMYINSVAASGGYYIAVSGKKIYANTNALIGSIGVVMQNISFAKLAHEYGIKDDTLSVGEYKHFISPIKEMDEKTKAYLNENLLLPIYKNFSHTVAKERKITKEDEERFFGGRVFVAGDEKVKGVLVDEILSYTQMLALVKNEQKTQEILKLDFKDKPSDVLSKLLTVVKAFEEKGFLTLFL